jgi:hypothetical protein
VTRGRAGECATGCVFPEITIGTDAAAPLLPLGTRVLGPCQTCGTPAAEEFAANEHALTENSRAFARYLAERLLPLYHWSPRARRGQIIRYGLRPHMRPTTHTNGASGREVTGWRAGYTCFSDTPLWAWSLSGGQRSAPRGEWDLWSTRMDLLTEPRVEPADWSNGIHEVRTAHRVYKRDLWHVATRESV